MTTIVLFAYNRPTHLAATITALANNRGASKSRLVIFSDGPRGVKERILVDQVRRICESASGFKKVDLIPRNTNIGLAMNIITGLNEIFSFEKKIIVMEDDLVASPGFLTYMNEALSYYEGKGILSVCGYSPPGVVPPSYPYSTYTVNRIGSWGWATWSECWEKVDWEVKDFNRFIISRDDIDGFNKAGNDLTPMLLKQQLGRNNSWAIRFAYAGYRHGMPTVYPSVSLISNIGADGTGTHLGKTGKYSSPVSPSIDLTRFCPGNYADPTISSNFKSFYDTSSFRQLINQLLIIKTRARLIRDNERAALANH